MLSTAAFNALLKTLEEPPDHVKFMLATTDPEKVLPTIRSRTQHFEFRLLPAAELEALRSLDRGRRRPRRHRTGHRPGAAQGRGSARDTLSVLDRIVAAGGVGPRPSPSPVDQLLQALADRTTGSAIVAVADATGPRS